ncbi:MAG: hypothetical protein ACR2QT_13730 [Woeseiaceae bacterium]
MPIESLQALLSKYGLTLIIEAPGKNITGSFWGDSEAGIVTTNVFARIDTPVHSLLHETCHTICMDAGRRLGLDRDAGGDDLEEAAVCYLQILLAEQLPEVGGGRLMEDMDAWGYSFRLGSTALWFTSDAEDAAAWLFARGLIDNTGMPTFALRGGV